MIYEVEIDDGRGGMITKEYTFCSLPDVIHQTDIEITKHPKSRVKSVYAREGKNGKKTLIINELAPE
ncbi:MAG: hypothetical protein AB7P69_27070 [Candidatus Binatia bacterium]